MIVFKGKYLELAYVKWRFSDGAVENCIFYLPSATKRESRDKMIIHNLTVAVVLFTIIEGLVIYLNMVAHSTGSVVSFL